MPLGYRSLLSLRKIAGTAGPGPHFPGRSCPRLSDTPHSGCQTNTDPPDGRKPSSPQSIGAFSYRPD
jgi:hypothetical protein